MVNVKQAADSIPDSKFQIPILFVLYPNCYGSKIQFISELLLLYKAEMGLYLHQKSYFTGIFLHGT